jgi:hypothetical protein
MRSLKAIAAGCVFIFIVVLLIQLANIFIAVGYNSLAKNYPFLKDISGYFRYVIGIPVFSTVMFTGGYITASLAKEQVLLHCVIVAILTIAGTLFPVLQDSELTTTGMVVIVLILVATTSGGLYWQKSSAGQR